MKQKKKKKIVQIVVESKPEVAVIEPAQNINQIQQEVKVAEVKAVETSKPEEQGWLRRNWKWVTGVGVAAVAVGVVVYACTGEKTEALIEILPVDTI